MIYDFDTLYSGKNRASEKWEAMFNEAARLGIELKGDELPFTVADMEFASAPEIRRRLGELAALGLWGYTGSDKELKSSIVTWFSQRHGWEIDESWIVSTGGVVPAIFTAVNCYTEPGDSVIIQPPVYRPFYLAAKKKR